MTGPDAHNDPVICTDGRQSETAAAIQRGVGRMLRGAGFANSVAEYIIAALLALGKKGEIWIVEIKSSPADYLSDSKWRDYMDFCDRFYFAIPPDMDPALIDNQAGLIIADAWGAEIVREANEEKLASARRKAVTLLLARAAAMRLQSAADPNADNLL